MPPQNPTALRSDGCDLAYGYVWNGSAWVEGTQPLTDVQLRAVPVPMRLRADPTYYVWVPQMALAQNKYFLAIRNTAAQVVKLRKVFLVNAALAAVTGVGVQFDVRRISAITGGTAITPNPADTADGALPNVTVVHSPTAVTEGALLYSWFTNNDEIGLTGGFPQATLQSLISLQPEGNEVKELTLNNGEGMCLKQITSTTVGSFGVLAVLTLGA
jgi:hypothetical protein